VRFPIILAGYRRTDHIRYQIIRQELNIFNILNKVTKYQRNYFCHLGKMDESRFITRFYQYSLKGMGRGRCNPYNRWEDQF
jgi:hypothetical protein